ncbi:MAG: DinB family protein [Chloroflexota bacterium]
MLHNQVFKARHTFAREIFYDNLFGRWTDAQLRTPVHPSGNSLIWIIWHIARVEDSGVSRFVLGEEQLLHTGNWNAKLGLESERFGFGDSTDEMLMISQHVDIPALRDYWAAVIERTWHTVDTVTEVRLAEVLSEAEVRQVVIDEGVAPPNVQVEVIPIYTGWTRLEALYHFSMTHYYWHGGEVRTIEGVLRHGG